MLGTNSQVLELVASFRSVAITEYAFQRNQQNTVS